MKINYTGLVAFTPFQQRKLTAKYAKLAKLLDRGGERAAHVILTAQRHLQRAEITVKYYDHDLVGLGSHTDAFQAILTAVDKLEKQLLKKQTKWRDVKRTAAGKAALLASPVDKAEKPKASAKPKASPKPPAASSETRVFKVNNKQRKKPMTMEEAVLVFEDNGKGYMVYRDSDSDRLHVLVKRSDGHFDLIES
jgi:ribosomal subunit interface protein